MREPEALEENAITIRLEALGKRKACETVQHSSREVAYLWENMPNQRFALQRLINSTQHDILSAK